MSRISDWIAIIGLIFIATFIVFSFVLPSSARCSGLCGPDTCTLGVGCLSNCVCIMPDGVRGYCAEIR